MERGLDIRPILQTIGFNKDFLINVIRNSVARITGGGRLQRRLFNRNYIRYEGEPEAINERGLNINNKGLNVNDRMPKSYLMMIYNELRLRGLLNATS